MMLRPIRPNPLMPTFTDMLPPEDELPHVLRASLGPFLKLPWMPRSHSLLFLAKINRNATVQCIPMSNKDVERKNEGGLTIRYNLRVLSDFGDLIALKRHECRLRR